MNYLQAVELMKQGSSVESQVSKTIYETTETGLFAEGLPVPNEYLTLEEANGSWEEVRVIDTKEDFEKLSAEEKTKILEDGLIYFEFNEKHNK